MSSKADREAGLALTSAVYKGKKKLVRDLLSAGAPLDVVDAHDKSALMCAAARGDKKLVTMLIEAGADLNLANVEGRTALIYAATYNRHRVVSLLIEAGADVNASDCFGENALDIALRNTGNLFSLWYSRSAHLLIKAGVKRSRKPSSFDVFRNRIQQAKISDEFNEWTLKLPAKQYALLNSGVLGITAAYAPGFETMGMVLGGGIFLLVATDLLLVFPSCLQGLAKVVGLAEIGAKTDASVTTSTAPEKKRFTDVEFISRIINNRSDELRITSTNESDNTLIGRKYDSERYVTSTPIWLIIATLYLLILAEGWVNPESVFGRVILVIIFIWLVLKLERKLRWSRLKRVQDNIDAKAAKIGGLLEQDDISVGSLEREFGVYLRPFVTTNRIPLGRIDLETLLAYSLVPLLPIIALGRPGEHVGVGRIQTGNENWKEKVSAMLNRSELILCIPSARSGTMWELEQLKTCGLLDKTVFIMPRDFALPTYDQPLGNLFSREWEETVKTVNSLGLQLPSFTSKGMFFKLGSDGRLLAKVPLEVSPLLLVTPSSGGSGGGDGDGDGDGGGGGNGG